MHVDPAHTSAWNALAVGRKWWVLVSPDQDRSDEHYGTGGTSGGGGDSQSPVHSDYGRGTLNRRLITDNDGDGALTSHDYYHDKNKIHVLTEGQDKARSSATPDTTRVRREENIPYWFYNTFPQIVQENERSSRTKKQIYSFIQEEGEIVFVPCGWSHAVLNLEESVAVTHNFVSKNNTLLFINWFQSNREALNLSEEDHDECVAILKTKTGQHIS